MEVLSESQEQSLEARFAELLEKLSKGPLDNTESEELEGLIHRKQWDFDMIERDLLPT